MSGFPASMQSKGVRSSLECVLAYENRDVVSRFAEDHGVSVEEADELFTETKRWLWLCAKRKTEIENGAEAFQIPLFNEAFAIDLMWHKFLLFTQDYADFCEQYFGFFIHHQPRPIAERLRWKEQIESDPVRTRQEREASLKKVYGYIYDQLGPEILMKWCEEFPERFSFQFH